MNNLFRYSLRYAFLILIFLLFSVSDVEAQCAMCRAVAENSIDEGGFGIAAGLNSGILFLMAIPYILLATLFIVFFRKQIGGFLRAFNDIH
jgi:hypothetical protein